VAITPLARFNLRRGQLSQPLHVALTGGTVSLGIYEVIAVLGALALSRACTQQ
jgi:hypothetical protein